MDPITAIATALVLGAAAAGKELVSLATKDAYQALKSYLLGKYQRVRLSDIEEKPSSSPRRAVLQEQLGETDIAGDQKAAALAQALVDAVATNDRDVAEIVGVDLEEIKAASISLRDIVSSGHGVRIKSAEATGDIRIENVRAGTGREDPSGKK